MTLEEKAAQLGDFRLTGAFEIVGDKVDVAGKRAFLSVATVS